MKRGKPLKRTPLRRGTTSLKVGSSIPPRSPKQKQINREWNTLVAYLAEYRAHYKDELSGRYVGFVGKWGLQGAHIKPRRYNIHNAGNCLIADGITHDHSKYGSGLPISQEDTLSLVVKLNKEHGIDPALTGAMILGEHAGQTLEQWRKEGMEELEWQDGFREEDEI